MLTRSLLLTPQRSGRGHQPEKPSRTPICACAFVVGVIWLLEGSLSRLQSSSGRNTGLLGSSFCLTAPAVPGHLPRMWPWEHQGAPTDRWLCPGAESLAFQLLSQKPCGGLNGISRGAASGWGRCLVASRAKLLNERCWLIYMLSEFLNLSEPVSSSVFWGYEQH